MGARLFVSLVPVSIPEPPPDFALQRGDLAHLIFFVALGVAALFSFVLLMLPPDKAQRIVRGIVKLMFGKKD